MKNELRIGNYVSTGFMNPSPSGLQKCFNKCEVKSIGIEKVIVTEKIGRKGLEKHNYENLKPIPLTEEWLLKFGFVKILNQYKKATKTKPFIILFLENQFQYDDLRYRTNLNHVHQLQNLYFALTNEELTFKK